MKGLETPVPPAGTRQLNLSFDAGRTAALDAAERHKAVLALAQILMQAAGLATEDLADDER
jgi:hypothetical protein